MADRPMTLEMFERWCAGRDIKLSRSQREYARLQLESGHIAGNQKAGKQFVHNRLEEYLNGE